MSEKEKLVMELINVVMDIPGCYISDYYIKKIEKKFRKVIDKAMIPEE